MFKLAILQMHADPTNSSYYYASNGSVSDSDDWQLREFNLSPHANDSGPDQVLFQFYWGGAWAWSIRKFSGLGTMIFDIAVQILVIVPIFVENRQF